MTTELRPQPGPQEAFLSSSADIAIYGGSAGSGKSFGLLLEMLFDISLSGFRAVIFRRTIPMIRQPGGLLDVSNEVYPLLGAKLNQNDLRWDFPSGASVKLGGMELEQDRYAWQGSQIALIAFDEVQEFSENQFWFLASRNRSLSGARSRIRCTCNPDSDSWLRNFLAWWINPDTGFPVAERSGVLRWFIRQGDALVWGDSRTELVEKFGPDCGPRSVTFISARVTDNQILLAKDPAYLSNLKALPYVERARLLDGNWNVRASAGNYFRREWFGIVEAAPAEVVARCRYWDRAASQQRPGTDPDATVGVLLSKDRQGIYYIEDVRKMFASPHMVEKAMRECAERDGTGTTIGFMQDPGSAGVAEAQNAARALDGFNVKFATATGDKETRAKPASAQCEAGNIKVVRGSWNDEFLRVLENFPTGRHDDEVDGLSGAHATLTASPYMRPGIFWLPRISESSPFHRYLESTKSTLPVMGGFWRESAGCRMPGRRFKAP
jgi:predicted phage terminase large subunit-like protein